MKIAHLVAAMCGLAAVAVARNATSLVPARPMLAFHHSGMNPAKNTRTASAVVLPRERLPFLLNAPGGVDSIFALQGYASRHFTLLIVFSNADCYGKLADIPFWSEIQERYGDKLRVIGITSGETPEFLRYFLTQQAVHVPVAYDSAGTVRDAIYQGGFLTPAMVLLDSSGTVVRVEESRAGNAPLQAAYLMTLDRIIGAANVGHK